MTNPLAPLEKYRDNLVYCLQCGLCLTECPVFKSTRLASLTSRGRMRILAGLLDGEITISKRVEEVFNQCLLCEACAKVCPSGIPVGEIFATARSVVNSQRGLPLTKRLILWTFSNLKRTGKLASLFSMPAKLVTTENATGLKPKMLINKIVPLAELPKFGDKTFLDKFAGIHRPNNHPIGRIGYFVGCMTNLVYQNTGEAVLNYLLSCNYEVIIPKEQGCCGLPAFASGELNKAQEQVSNNVRAFNQEKVDFIIADCASCVSMWKEHSRIHENNIKVSEIMGFLDNNNLVPEKFNSSEEIRLGYHAPCHTRGDEVSRKAPRKLLKNNNEYQYIQLEYEEKCCGGGGSFGCFNPELMINIQEEKITEIKEKNVNKLITTCPSCRLYLISGLARHNHKCIVCHPLELI
ncbi:MAG: (Fe-S)-binding protein [Bacillota bacterium]